MKTIDYVKKELDAIYRLDSLNVYDLNSEYTDELNILEDAIRELAEYRKKEAESK